MQGELGGFQGRDGQISLNPDLGFPPGCLALAFLSLAIAVMNGLHHNVRNLGAKGGGSGVMRGAAGPVDAVCSWLCCSS